MFRKGFGKLIFSVFSLSPVVLGTALTTELDEIAVSKFLLLHASKLSSTQMQFGSMSSPSSHTIKDVVSIPAPGDSVDTLIASEQWRKDEALRTTFIERYRKLQSESFGISLDGRNVRYNCRQCLFTNWLRKSHAFLRRGVYEKDI